MNYIDETSNKQFVLEFCGGKEIRFAEYRYYDIDDVIKRVLEVVEER